MKQNRRILTTIVLLALATLLAASCCNRKKAEDQRPAAVPEENALCTAIDAYLAGEIGSYYDAAPHRIPFCDYLAVDDTTGEIHCDMPDSSSIVYPYKEGSIDELPRFKGGSLDVFHKWVHERVRYVNPETCISGRVTLRFVVGEDGRVSDVEVLRGVDPEFDEEAIRVVSSSPKWKPGKHRGKPVSVFVIIPVSFRIQ